MCQWGQLTKWPPHEFVKDCVDQQRRAHTHTCAVVNELAVAYRATRLMSVRVAMDNSSTDVNRLPPQGQSPQPTQTHAHNDDKKKEE